MKKFKISLLFVLITILSSDIFAEVFNWPDGKNSAVVLTYDDSLPSQLTEAIPQLDQAGFKATFFLSARFEAKYIDAWRNAASNGHELANHTLFHPCLKDTFPMDSRYNNENYSVDNILDELTVMNLFLSSIDGYTSRTYANTCGQDIVASGESYAQKAYQKGLFTAIRSVGNQEHNPKLIKPWAVPSEWFSPNTTGEEMISRVKVVQNNGGLLVLGFHGIGADHALVPSEAHQTLLNYLKEHENYIWVTRFDEAMAWIKKNRN